MSSFGWLFVWMVDVCTSCHCKSISSNIENCNRKIEEKKTWQIYDRGNGLRMSWSFFADGKVMEVLKICMTISQESNRRMKWYVCTLTREYSSDTQKTMHWRQHILTKWETLKLRYKRPNNKRFYSNDWDFEFTMVTLKSNCIDWKWRTIRAK